MRLHGDVDEAHTHGHDHADTDPLAALTRAWEGTRGQQLAIDQGDVDAATTGLSTPELARRRARLNQRLAAVSPAPDRRVAWAVEERDSAQAQLAAAQQRHAAAQARVDAASRGPGRTRRAERVQARERLCRRGGEVALWQQRLAEVDQRLDELRGCPGRCGTSVSDLRVRVHRRVRLRQAE